MQVVLYTLFWLSFGLGRQKVERKGRETNGWSDGGHKVGWCETRGCRGEGHKEADDWLQPVPNKMTTRDARQSVLSSEPVGSGTAGCRCLKIGIGSIGNA